MKTIIFKAKEKKPFEIQIFKWLLKNLNKIVIMKFFLKEMGLLLEHLV